MEIFVIPYMVSIICQVVLCLSFAVFLLLRHRSSRAARWLAAFCIAFSVMQFGYEIISLTPSTRLGRSALITAAFVGAGAMVPMAMTLHQFAYAVRGNPFRREAAAMKWFELAFCVGIVGAMTIGGDAVFATFEAVLFPVVFLTTLVLSAATPVVFFRKTVHFSRKALAKERAGANASRWRAFVQPTGVDARACAAYTWLGLSWFVLIVSALFTWAIPFTQDFFPTLVTIATFLFLYGLVVVYATYAEERTTLQVKLVGSVLATIVLFLSVAATNLFGNFGIVDQVATTQRPHEITFSRSGDTYVPESSWIDLGESSTTGPGSDDTADEIVVTEDLAYPIGFSFPFFSAAWDSVIIGTDGALRFGGSSEAVGNSAVNRQILYGRRPAVIPLLSDYELPLRLDIRSTDSSLSLSWNDLSLTRSGNRYRYSHAATLHENGDIKLSYRSPAGQPHAASIYQLGGRGIHRGLPGLKQSDLPPTVRFVPGDDVPPSDTALIEDFALQAFQFADFYGKRLLVLLVAVTGFCLLVIPTVFRIAVLNPVGRLLEGVERVERGDLSVRVDLPKQDEIGELAEHFNSMTERIEVDQRHLAQHAVELELRVSERTAELSTTLSNLQAAQQQLVQQEKLASLGSLTAGIAHEIKNPLNFVNNFAELNQEMFPELMEAIAKGEPVDDLIADLALNTRQIASHGKRADSIVRSMMLHAAGGTGERESIDFNTFVDEYVALAYHGMRAQDPDFNVTIKRNFSSAVGTVTLVPQDMDRVLLNVVGNALYATRARQRDAAESYEPTLTISTTIDDQDRVTLTVQDNGPGVPAEILKRIFEPFFTTKPTGDGTGLGLSLSHDIVVAGHGGALTVDNVDGGGAVFKITLPVSTEARGVDPQ